MAGETNAVEMRLDAIEGHLLEMEKAAEARVDRLIVAMETRAAALLLAVERAIQPFLDSHAAVEKLRAELGEVAARVTKVEVYCPECPRRLSPTPPPNDEDGT